MTVQFADRGAAFSSGPRDHPPSAWLATANSHPDHPALAGDLTVDTVVIGGGFTGLSAARELTAQGLSSAILEANRIGWGASGRNGGMAVLRYKRAWSDLAASYGDAATRQMYDWIQEAVAIIERNVAELGIACDFGRYGHITAAPHPRSLERLRADLRWLEAQVGDRTVSIVGADRAQEMTGSAIYAGAYFDPRSAGLHPLNYCRGLAAALAKLGVPVHEGTPVTSLTVESDGVIAETSTGLVRAKTALVCANAYTDSFPLGYEIDKRVIPISVAVIATAPLPSTLRATILRNRNLVTDTRNLVNYYRVLPDGRLLFGGRGSLSGKEGKQNYARLQRQLLMTFPQLRDVPLEHQWSGRIALSLDSFPHIGAIGGRLFHASGYGGRGVALSHLLGTRLARYAAGLREPLGPMSEAAFKPIPFRGVRMPIMHAGAIYYRTKDAFGL